MRPLLVLAFALSACPVSSSEPDGQSAPIAQVPRSPTKVLFIKIKGRGRILYRGEFRLAGNGGGWLETETTESVSCLTTAQARNTGGGTDFRLSLGSNPLNEPEIRLVLSSSPQVDYSHGEGSCEIPFEQMRVFEKVIELMAGRDIKFTLDDYHFFIRRKR